MINLLNKKINEFRYQWETIRGKRKQGMISEDEYTVENIVEIMRNIT